MLKGMRLAVPLNHELHFVALGGRQRKVEIHGGGYAVAVNRLDLVTHLQIFR